MSVLDAIQKRMDKGEHDDYFVLMKERLSELYQQGETNLLVEHLSVLGRNLVWSGKIKEGYIYQSEAQLASTEAALADHIRLELEHNWGEIYIAMGRYHTALKHIELGGQGYNPKHQMNYHRLRSMAFNELEDAAKAKICTQNHYFIAESLGSSLDMARALRNEAIAEMTGTEYKKGSATVLDTLERAKSLAAHAQNVDVHSAIAYAESLWLEKSECYEAALHVAKEGYEQTCAVGYVHRSMLMCYRIARSAAFMGNVEEAKEYAGIAHGISLGDGFPYRYSGYLTKIESLQKNLFAAQYRQEFNFI